MNANESRHRPPLLPQSGVYNYDTTLFDNEHGQANDDSGGGGVGGVVGGGVSGVASGAQIGAVSAGENVIAFASFCDSPDEKIVDSRVWGSWLRSGWSADLEDKCLE